MAKTDACKKILKEKPKLEVLDQITKSKQLIKKRNSRNNQSIINRNNTRRCNKRKREDLRLSDSRNPFPSLADLEKMFEDSDETIMVPSTSETNSTQLDNTEIPKTVVSNDLYMPCVVLTDIETQFTSLDKENYCASSACDDCEGPSPNKKLKKDHDLNELEPNLELEICQSPEITDLHKSFDSNETITYEVETSGRFSPLPSTSKDSAKILENEKRFTASLIKSNENIQKACSITFYEESQSDVEVIETPVETITITDEGSSIRSLPLLQKVEPVDSGIVIILDDDTTKQNNSEVIRVNGSTNIRESQYNVSTHNEISIPNQGNVNEVIDVENYVNGRDFGKINNIDDECALISFGSHVTNLIGNLLTKVDTILNNSGEVICTEPKRKENLTTLNEINSSTPIKHKRKSSPQSNNNSSVLKDCPICLDSLTTKEIASTICGHIFCLECMKMSTKKGIRKCPTCRKALKGVGYHQIFL